MTRSPVGLFLLLVALLGTIGLGGCGGTETGNPSGPPGDGDVNPAYKLVDEVCGKLYDCRGEAERFSQDDCLLAVQDSDTLAAAFGIEEEPTPQYALVIDKVEDNELSADDEAVDRCVDAIQFLSCEDEDVLAVDIGEGFRDVEGMIPQPSCSGVFAGS